MELSSFFSLRNVYILSGGSLDSEITIVCVINPRPFSLFDNCVPMSDVHFKLYFFIPLLQFTIFQLLTLFSILEALKTSFLHSYHRFCVQISKKATFPPLAAHPPTLTPRCSTPPSPHLRNSLRKYKVVATMTARRQHHRPHTELPLRSA